MKMKKFEETEVDTGTHSHGLSLQLFPNKFWGEDDLFLPCL